MRLRCRAERVVPTRARRHHRPTTDFARDTGVIVRPDEATQVADAIMRVFIEHGNRTDRNKSRMKYVLDAWGMEKYIAHVEEKLGRALVKVPAEAVEHRPDFDRSSHIGVHPQKQTGLNWIGVVLPVGRLTTMQMRGLAKVAQDFGDGDIRLTVWQNLLISGVADAKVVEAQAAIAALGLATEANLGPCRAGGLHWSDRLPFRGRAYQGAGGGDCLLVRGARRHGYAGEHSSHRLPSLLRAALYRRHRSHRLQRSRSARATMPSRSRAITSLSAAASARRRASAARSIAM